MVTQKSIDDFLSQSSFAVVGVSQDQTKYGNIVYRNLREKGFRVFAVNPKISEVEGDPCFATIDQLPEKVGGVVLVIPPHLAEDVIAQAYRAGISHIWLQEGAESPEAIQFGEERGMNVVYGMCVMEQSDPV